MAYSTHRMEFLVATPISMIKPISEGMEKLFPVINRATNAPPNESGKAAKIVMGCNTLLNSSTSTK